ncbi:MAG: 4-hydroxy-3-methylbut-2-enyl diphosphate reductase [Bacteroidales bacterium]|jgi:4-hydroxy-3-methylbut-2-enyl diphosphate reductase|nr:4-hydroxy-3-methylbut-2-enyl diphosphate reductase [Bacteroidales bacterium]
MALSGDKKLIIEIDSDSGFCYGVVRAIRMAEDELQRGNGLFSLGDIVHNESEVARLNQCGMQTINHEGLKSLHDMKVLIRAHGEPPLTYRIASGNNISIVDATCPVVLNLQKKVHKAFLKSKTNNGQVVIYGKPGHAEVNGLVGQTMDTAIVIASENEIDRIDISRPLYLFSQTTMTISGLQRIRKAIEKERNRKQIGKNIPFEVNDTICRQVSNREPKLIGFSAKHDVIVFVSGSKSSNGRALYEVCKQANPNSYLIANPDDLDKNWFSGASSVGVCGATSTPRWLMEKIANEIEKINLY